MRARGVHRSAGSLYELLKSFVANLSTNTPRLVLRSETGTPRHAQGCRPSETSHASPLALFKIELARRQDRDCFNALDLFGNPQVWHAGFVKLAAQLREIDIYRAKQD
jgi:hypothetical protein